MIVCALSCSISRAAYIPHPPRVRYGPPFRRAAATSWLSWPSGNKVREGGPPISIACEMDKSSKCTYPGRHRLPTAAGQRGLYRVLACSVPLPHGPGPPSTPCSSPFHVAQAPRGIWLYRPPGATSTHLGLSRPTIAQPEKQSSTGRGGPAAATPSLTPSPGSATYQVDGRRHLPHGGPGSYVNKHSRGRTGETRVADAAQDGIIQRDV